MKKPLLTTLVLLVAASLAGAATEAPAAKTSPARKTPTTAPANTRASSSTAREKKNAAAEAAVVEKFISLQDAAIATFLELGDTLQSVKSRESADAAAPTVKVAGEQLYTIISAVEALGEPSEAAQQAIMARAANEAEKNEIVEQVMLPLLTLMMQEPPCYGSEALREELSALLENIQGAAGADEVEAAPAPLAEPDAEEQQPSDEPQS